jgi:hypothetical protein
MSESRLSDHPPVASLSLILTSLGRDWHFEEGPLNSSDGSCCHHARLVQDRLPIAQSIPLVMMSLTGGRNAPVVVMNSHGLNRDITLMTGCLRGRFVPVGHVLVL